jgi:hypothetical protein
MLLDAAAQLLDQMPEAPKVKPRVFDQPPPSGHYWCACYRHKAIPLQKMRFCNTKFLPGVTDSVCDECFPSIKNMVAIVCIRCQTIVARMEPIIFPSGFRMRPGEYYHTDACPKCRPKECVPNISPLRILERYFYEKENGLLNKNKS